MLIFPEGLKQHPAVTRMFRVDALYDHQHRHSYGAQQNHFINTVNVQLKYIQRFTQHHCTVGKYGKESWVF